MKTREEIEQIDFKPLQDALSKRLGVDIVLDINIVSKKWPDRNIVHFRSQDLKDKTGILSDVYEYLHVTDFGSEFGENDNRLWMGINLSFQYVRGGSNGTNIGHCWYYFDKKEWKFDM